MPFLYSLCSSSKGNATYVGDRHAGILIDAGITLRALAAKLTAHSIALSAIRGIFITHEHSDHISGLKAISQNLKVPVFASREVLEYLAGRDILRVGTKAYVMGQNPADFGDLSVRAFSTPHDSMGSKGYKIYFSGGKTAAVCTDLGHVTQEVSQHILGCDCVLLESNYDEGMLLNGSYPYFLKQRIRSKWGHLSNAHCASTVVELIHSGTPHIMLGHLSEENNRPELALRSAVAAIETTGAVLKRDYILRVSGRLGADELMEV